MPPLKVLSAYQLDSQDPGHLKQSNCSETILILLMLQAVNMGDQIESTRDAKEVKEEGLVRGLPTCPPASAA